MAFVQRFAVYGSLRKGHYNFDKMNAAYGNGMQYERTFMIKGFSLHDLGEYPAVSLDRASTLTVEVMRVTDSALAEALTDMELEAGYIPLTLHVGGEACTLFVHKGAARYPRVASGDWSAHKAAK